MIIKFAPYKGEIAPQFDSPSVFPTCSDGAIIYDKKYERFMVSTPRGFETIDNVTPFRYSGITSDTTVKLLMPEGVEFTPDNATLGVLDGYLMFSSSRGTLSGELTIVYKRIGGVTTILNSWFSEEVSTTPNLFDIDVSVDNNAISIQCIKDSTSELLNLSVDLSIRVLENM